LKVVVAVAFSPDGKILASAGGDGKVRLWNVADPAAAGPLGPPLAGHSALVVTVAFAPDGKILASASQDKTMQLWALG
jgi:WD40 repeat protein